jgi:DHA1 family inner membrane transport protein
VAVAALGVISLVGILAFVPAGTTAETTDVRTEISALRRPGVWLTMGIAACSIGAVFAMFTYIAPLLTEVAGYSQEWVAPVLVVFGLGLVAGNVIGGRFADTAQLRSIGIGNAVSTGALLLLAAGVTVPGLAPVALALCGAAAMATVPGFITRIIEQAKEAPVLGATLGASGANLGISVGAYLSGVAVDADLGLRAPAIVGASMAATGLALTLAAARAQRRTLANRPDAMAPA